MWGLLGPGIELVSLALAGTFLTTRPPEKSYTFSNFLFSRLGKQGATAIIILLQFIVRFMCAKQCWGLLYLISNFRVFIQIHTNKETGSSRNISNLRKVQWLES